MPEKYTYDYPMFSVATDIVVFGLIDERPHILLIKRKNDPFKDCWALPGGFVNIDEAIRDAAARELQEETSITIEPAKLRSIGSFTNPNRDPRGRTISFAFTTSICQSWMNQVKAQDDAADFQWFPILQLPQLAFDHLDIIEHALVVHKGFDWVYGQEYFEEFNDL